MKILSVDPSAEGGVCQDTYFLNNALQNQGLEIIQITGMRNEFRDKKKTYRVITFPNILDKICFDLQNKLRIKRISLPRNFFILLLARVIKPEIVHFQWVNNYEEERKLFLDLKNIGIKVVYTAQNILPHEREGWHNLYQRLYGVADRVVALSPRAREKILELFNIEPERVCYVPPGSNGFSDNPCNALERDLKENIRKELGFLPNEKLILFFGYIREYKGLDFLIKSFARLSSLLYQPVRLIIAGKPVENFNKYSCLIRKLGVEEKVFLHLHYLPLNMAEKYFLASDVMVLPYRRESLTGIIFNAYYYGRPVVGTDVLGVGEFIENGKSGYIVSFSDEKDLARVLLKVLSDEIKLQSMGEYARHLAETRYSWSNVAQMMKKMYVDLVNGEEK